MAIIALSEDAIRAGRQRPEAPEDSPEEPGKIEIKHEFVELRAKGWSYTRISKRLKVSKSTLSSWRAELEEEIASLRAMELESLQERYWMAKEGKIKLLGDQLKAIQKELKDRDKALADVPTDKLLEIQLKYYLALQEEYTEPRPLSSEEIGLLKALRIGEDDHDE